ncbi:integrase arm-type DNA-binding domain-containing protein [Uliginosibacterium sp. 31-12]|uniref:tyrosine-type recombinase/integrase n=1 Tax=Uliginosibacterium sp. 31-12 TaxID=3062781 RepID=UPI0026E3CE74|nr:integrase arm-type DNA-binding domain-containing protein [Uliginosibacterium sp. 31-12]MDO6387651.1 tyrosine-type recombinase/integrase [Uliginosibacterium sp. 31-12]
MLTDAHCRNAKPREKLYRLKDFNGLYLEIKPSGIKAWRYRYKLNNKESMFALGNYPDMGLADARERCDEVRKQVKQGIHPVVHRKQEKARLIKEAANTFEALATEWLSLKSWEAVTKARRLNMLERVVFPTIGKLPIKQITPPIILSILLKSSKENGVTVAAEAKRTMFGIFELACETFRVDANPVHQWREALPKNKTQHKRALSTAEIGQLLKDFSGHGGHFQTIYAFRLMWLTLTRPNEAVRAEWTEIDLETGLWKIQAHRMKNRREHVVPLPRQAVDLLKALHPITGSTPFVFPCRDDRNKPMADATIRQALKKLGWATKYSPHGTRTTGSTRLNELGHRGDVIEAQLAHTEPNSVRRTYNHATYLDERREMMQKWADMLDELVEADKRKPVSP